MGCNQSKGKGTSSDGHGSLYQPAANEWTESRTKGESAEVVHAMGRNNKKGAVNSSPNTQSQSSSASPESLQDTSDSATSSPKHTKMGTAMSSDSAAQERNKFNSLDAQIEANNSNHHKASMDSRSSANTKHGGRSARSSFAVDAVGPELPLGPVAAKNRTTFEQLRGTMVVAGGTPVEVSPGLKKPLQRLAILPYDTPVPVTMLQKLWQLHTLSDAATIAQLLQQNSLMRIATLDDGSTWCLIANDTIDMLADKYEHVIAGIHSELLDAYTATGPTGNALQVKDVPDDGYFMQNVAHHLAGAGRYAALRNLLGEPAWLESKLHAYGTASVVADFRRYLAEAPEDSGARLLLQALQLSLGCCAEHQSTRMLREQMLARLMMVVLEPSIAEIPSLHALGADPAAAVCSPGKQSAVARSDTDTSAGGLGIERFTTAVSDHSVDADKLSRHTSTLQQQDADSGQIMSPDHASRGAASLAASPNMRDSARISGPGADLKEWYEAHSSRAGVDIVTAAGYQCVHLLPRSASLKQAGGMQRMILRGHKGPIRKVVISPNGQDVVTISEDGTAQVWDMNVGDCVMQLARQHALSDVEVAQAGDLCLVASVDGAACVWDVSSGAVKHVLKGHTGKINSLAIDRDGRTCVTASDDRSVRVWSIASGKCQAVLSGHGKGGASAEFGLVFDVALSTDGCLAATGSEDFTARVWDLDEFKCMHVLEGHSGWVVQVCFVADTTHIITASHDGTARIWDGLRGKCLHVLSGHTGRLNKVAVDAAGKYAVTCSDDMTARVWDVETGACTAVLKRHEAWVADACFSRDGGRCVTVGGDGLVCVWSIPSGRLQAALEGHSEPLRSVVITSGGRFAVTAGDDGTAIVWDLALSVKHGMYLEAVAKQGHRGRITGLQGLSGGRYMASSCEGGRILLWDIATCKPLSSEDALPASTMFLAASRDGCRVVTGSAARQVVRWDLAQVTTSTGNANSNSAGQVVPSGVNALRHVLTRSGAMPSQQGSRVKHMAISEDASKVAVVLYDSSVSVFDIASGRLDAQLMGRGERLGRNVHTSGVNGVLLFGGANGASTAVTWAKDCTARVWDVSSSQVLRVMEGHTEGIRCAVLNHDHTILATSSYGNCVRLHMLRDAAPLAVLDHAASAVHITFSPNSRFMAVGLENNTIVVWDLVAHNCLPPLQAHKSDITGITFSPDSHLLATCGQDCTTFIWNAYTGKQLALFVADFSLTSIAFAGGCSDVLAVGDAGGAIHFLDLPPELSPGNAVHRY